MKRILVLLFLAIPAFGAGLSKNTRAHDLWYGRENVVSVQFRVECATTASRPDNRVCASRMLKALQAAYNTSVDWTSIPLPSEFLEDKIVLVFTEKAVMEEDTLTLTVYETENNTVLHTSSRPVLLLGHDITKLLTEYQNWNADPTGHTVPAGYEEVPAPAKPVKPIVITPDVPEAQ